jgi:hypothetical protein
MMPSRYGKSECKKPIGEEFVLTNFGCSIHPFLAQLTMLVIFIHRVQHQQETAINFEMLQINMIFDAL